VGWNTYGSLTKPNVRDFVAVDQLVNGVLADRKNFGGLGNVKENRF
jgi:hypothetical protein